MSGDKSRKVFAPLNKEIFREILKKFADVVENKKTDAVSNKAKEGAWADVAKEFNGCTRISEMVSTNNEGLHHNKATHTFSVLFWLGKFSWYLCTQMLNHTG